MAFGEKISKQFVDALEGGHDSRAAVNLHNNEAGRLVRFIYFMYLFIVMLVFLCPMCIHVFQTQHLNLREKAKTKHKNQ